MVKKDGEDQREGRPHRQMGVPYITVTGTMALKFPLDPRTFRRV